jgi:hypothetical protein
MKTGLTLVVVLAAGNALAQPKVAADLTPDQVKAAIADTKNDGCYGLRAGRALMAKIAVGCFTTPYSRVVMAAQAAKKKYKPFTEADVTPEIVAPGELHIHAFAGDPVGPGMANVQAVVIMPKGAKDQAKAVQPTKSEEATAEYKNAMGAEFEGKSVTATFPLEMLSEANEVHIVYDAQLDKAFCEDCKVEFKLKDVR